jgi:hypothetical protein
VQDIYRIKLPGNAMLGEGKPENQNHAIIFTRGEGLQTIDMNQVCIISAFPSGMVFCHRLTDHSVLTGALHGGNTENEEFAARISQEA